MNSSVESSTSPSFVHNKGDGHLWQPHWLSPSGCLHIAGTYSHCSVCGATVTGGQTLSSSIHHNAKQISFLLCFPAFGMDQNPSNWMLQTSSSECWLAGVGWVNIPGVDWWLLPGAPSALSCPGCSHPSERASLSSAGGSPHAPLRAAPQAGLCSGCNTDSMASKVISRAQAGRWT